MFSFNDRLKNEINSWAEKGIITEDVKKRILDQYGEEYAERLKVQRQSRLIQTIVTLGAILIGAGVLLFLSANWQTLPVGIKLFIIFASIAASYGTGMWLESAGYQKTGVSFLFLGTLLYGAGIALIAQIYQVQAGSGTLFLLWAVGALATGLALGSELFLGFSSILFTLWTVFSRLAGTSFFFGGIRETFHAPYLISFIALALYAYAKKQEKLLAVTLLGFFLWIGFALMQWKAGRIDAAVFFYIFGVFLILLASYQIYLFGMRRSFVFAYSFYGMAMVLVASYLLSFNFFLNNAAGNAVLAGAVMGFRGVFWALAVITTGGCVAASFLFGANRFFRYGFLGLALLVLFALIFILFPVEYPQTAVGYYVYRRAELNPYMFLWNIVLAAESITLISFGYLSNERRYVNIGILFFALQVMSRYFDVFSLYFGTYGSFMIGGIILIGLGYILEKFRKRLLEKMREKGALAPLSS